MTAEVKEDVVRAGEDKRIKTGKYSEQVDGGRKGKGYRYATAPAINIAGKVDDEGRVGGMVPGEGPEPGIYKETKKRYSVFLRRRFPPAPYRRRFLSPSRCTPLLTRLSSKFTLYRRSTKPSRPLRGFIKNWGCNSPRGRPGGGDL